MAPGAAGKSVEYGDPFSIMGSDNEYWGIPIDGTHLAPAQMVQMEFYLLKLKREKRGTYGLITNTNII